MSPFELVFAVYGLLLGLAIAEVLGGFSRAFKLKRKARPVRIGWLTPLLGLFVTLDLMSFWLLAWEARDQIVANYATLVGVLAVVGVYYLSATLIFPEEPEEWPDFDDWYDQQKRMVVGGLLVANIGSWIGQGILEAVKPAPGVEMSDLAAVLVLSGGLGILVLFLVLLFVRSRPWNVALLLLLNALLLFIGIIEDFV